MPKKKDYEKLKGPITPSPLPEPLIEELKTKEKKVIEASGGKADIPILSYQFDNCTNNEKIVCTWDRVWRVYFRRFSIQTLSKIKFWTDNLSIIPDSGNPDPDPDTLIYLIRLSDNLIVAIDDDGNSNTTHPRDSYLEYTPSKTGWYMAIVTGYSSTNGGQLE